MLILAAFSPSHSLLEFFEHDSHPTKLQSHLLDTNILLFSLHAYSWLVAVRKLTFFQRG